MLGLEPADQLVIGLADRAWVSPRRDSKEAKRVGRPGGQVVRQVGFAQNGTSRVWPGGPPGESDRRTRSATVCVVFRATSSRRSAGSAIFARSSPCRRAAVQALMSPSVHPPRSKSPQDRPFGRDGIDFGRPSTIVRTPASSRLTPRPAQLAAERLAELSPRTPGPSCSSPERQGPAARAGEGPHTAAGVPARHDPRTSPGGAN